MADPVSIISGIIGLLSMISQAGKKNTTRTEDDPRYKSPSLQVLDPALLQGVLGSVQRTQNFGFPTEGRINAAQSDRINQTLGALGGKGGDDRGMWDKILGDWTGSSGKYGRIECAIGLAKDYCPTGMHCVDGYCEPGEKVRPDKEDEDEDVIAKRTDPRYRSPTLQILDPLMLGQTMANFGRYENFGYPDTMMGLGGQQVSSRFKSMEPGGYLHSILAKLGEMWPEIIKDFTGEYDKRGGTAGPGSKDCDPPCDEETEKCVDKKCVPIEEK